ncbi:SAV_915 family protein [Streptomyces gamaensis]|uniref:SAV_915 family protein n=1 Tax=Streptomyces gamaensis TaxID=1763542 RepID=A0ABW0YYJ5_9ACTN
MSRTPAEAAAIAAVSCPQADESEPSEPAHPDGARPLDRGSADPLYVPVRPCADGFALRIFRSPLGARTAVAFTSRARLLAVLGAGHDCVRLSLDAVHALTAPLGIDSVRLDPQLTAPPVRTGPEGVEALPVFPG